MSPIRAVLFDVDGVLLDSTEANVAFYQELFRQIGDRQPEEKTLRSGKHLSVDAMLRQVFPDQPDGKILEWLRLADTIDAGFSLLRPMSGILDLVLQLVERYKLGIASNRNRAGMEELWRIVPLKKYFSAISCFEDTERHKPDPQPILNALQQLKVSPEQAVFIGDARSDLEAGLAAGVKVIILGQEQWPGVFATISSLAEAPNIIEHW